MSTRKEALGHGSNKKHIVSVERNQVHYEWQVVSSS